MLNAIVLRTTVNEEAGVDIITKKLKYKSMHIIVKLINSFVSI